jgi:hypothetical protein
MAASTAVGPAAIDSLKSSERQFIVQRNQCTNAACVAHAPRGHRCIGAGPHRGSAARPSTPGLRKFGLLLRNKVGHIIPRRRTPGLIESSPARRSAPESRLLDVGRSLTPAIEIT